MSCPICQRGNCTESFHSLEEQEAFSEATAAYEHYLDVRRECERRWLTDDEDEER